MLCSYELWLHGKDVGAHPEGPRWQKASPKPSQHPSISHQTVNDEQPEAEPELDKQQLEFLEDIRLKAVEMDVEKASVCDHGYNLRSNGRKRMRKMISERGNTKIRKSSIKDRSISDCSSTMMDESEVRLELEENEPVRSTKEGKFSNDELCNFDNLK